MQLVATRKPRICREPVTRIRVVLFALTGGLAAISGLLMTSCLGSGNSNIGFGVKFAVITSVIVGGASLFGGKGSMLGTLLGGLFIAVLNNAMVLLGINSYAQDVANGIVVLRLQVTGDSENPLVLNVTHGGA